MKKTLQSISFLFVGLILLSACSEEKTGKSPEKIADKIEVEVVEVVRDTVSTDSVVLEEPIVLLEPAPPVPQPVLPDPYPNPLPPDPLPDPPIDFVPEPIDEIPVFDIPDVETEFPGGTKAMMKFISDNIQYPIVDMEMGNQGRVYVEFIVNKDGSLNDIKVLRGVSKTLDKEAIRVISLMPNWTPGKIDGKDVRCRMRLPINFRLG